MREIAHVLSAADACGRPQRPARRAARKNGAPEDRSDRFRLTRGRPSSPSADTAPRQAGASAGSGSRAPRAHPLSPRLPARDTPLITEDLDPAATSLAVTAEPDGGSVGLGGRPLVQLTLKSVAFGE
ncbi:hypothetical protein GCM10010360_47920 [Streptomyces nogalater]